MTEYPVRDHPFMTDATVSRPPPPPVPRSFLEYIRSFGPGIVIVLTWLGAGDVVDMATAGANYGYALIWVFVVAILFRFLFVSLIVRYHLCNQHREGVLDGLARLHPLYAPVLFVAAVVMGHVYGLVHDARSGGGVPQRVWLRRDLAVGHPLQRHRVVSGLPPWFSPARAPVFLFLAVLSVSFVGSAIWVGFDPGDVARGLFRMEMPGKHGTYDPSQVALAMIGAVGGSHDESGVPVLSRCEGLAWSPVSSRAALRFHAWRARHARAQPLDLDPRRRAPLSRTGTSSASRTFRTS